MRASHIEEHIAEVRADCAIIACSILAGDMFIVLSPTRENIIIDAGYHRDEKLLAAIARLPGVISRIIITHQHVDHFGSLVSLQKKLGLTSANVLHSGIALPPNYLPPYSLSTCAGYDGDIERLWGEYHAAVGISDIIGTRWTSWSSGDLVVRNLLPEIPIGVKEQIVSSPSTVDFNRTATPTEVSFRGKSLAIVASDVNASDYSNIVARAKTTISLLSPASHGRPRSNPQDALLALSPDHVFISDHFQGSDFRPHYHASLSSKADIRAANVDGHQIYFFAGGKVVDRRSLDTSI